MSQTNPMKASDEWLDEAIEQLCAWALQHHLHGEQGLMLSKDEFKQRIQAHYQPQAASDELEQIIRFLLGETMLDGMWFGDQDSSKPLYWWRIPLRKALERPHPND